MSAPPYREQEWLAYNTSIRDLYREAGREPDDAYPIWGDRAVYDYASGKLSLTGSCAKHTAECRAALGLPGPPIPPVVPVQPFSVAGRFLYSGDRVYRWKAITAFALPAMVATGRAAEAREWMLARRGEGFGLFRVLSMCAWLNLGPQAGYDAVRILCGIARELGVALEVVALADTASFGFTSDDCIQRVRKIGEILVVESAGTAVEQAANEHYHATQIPWLHDVSAVDSLPAYAPNAIICTASPSANDEALAPTGDYVTRHLDRSRDLWNMVRRVRELENVSRDTNRYVVNDEPMGAGERAEAGRRYTDPAIAFTFGVLGRIFEVGSTFHCEAGLRCDELGPVQMACAEAFIKGATCIPDEAVLVFKNATWADSPVGSFDTAAAIRVYSGVQGNTGWTCALGLTGDPRIVWANGWAPQEAVGAYPGVTVRKIARA